MNEESFLEAMRTMRKAMDVIYPYCMGQYSGFQMLNMDKMNLRKENQELIDANQVQKAFHEREIKEMDEKLIEINKRCKTREDDANKRLSEVNAEIIGKRSELERLNAEIYRLGNIIADKKPQFQKVK